MVSESATGLTKLDDLHLFNVFKLGNRLCIVPSGESTRRVVVSSTNPKEIYNPYEGLAPRSGGVTSPSGSAPIPVQALVSEMAQMREEIDTLQQAIRERDNLPPAYDDA